MLRVCANDLTRITQHGVEANLLILFSSEPVQGAVEET